MCRKGKRDTMGILPPPVYVFFSISFLVCFLFHFYFHFYFYTLLVSCIADNETYAEGERSYAKIWAVLFVSELSRKSVALVLRNAALLDIFKCSSSSLK